MSVEGGLDRAERAAHAVHRDGVSRDLAARLLWPGRVPSPHRQAPGEERQHVDGALMGPPQSVDGNITFTVIERHRLLECALERRGVRRQEGLGHQPKVTVRPSAGAVAGCLYPRMALPSLVVVPSTDTGLAGQNADARLQAAGRVDKSAMSSFEAV